MNAPGSLQRLTTKPNQTPQNNKSQQNSQTTHVENGARAVPIEVNPRRRPSGGVQGPDPILGGFRSHRVNHPKRSQLLDTAPDFLKRAFHSLSCSGALPSFLPAGPAVGTTMA